MILNVNIIIHVPLLTVPPWIAREIPSSHPLPSLSRQMRAHPARACTHHLPSLGSSARGEGGAGQVDILISEGYWGHLGCLALRELKCISVSADTSVAKACAMSCSLVVIGALPVNLPTCRSRRNVALFSNTHCAGEYSRKAKCSNLSSITYSLGDIRQVATLNKFCTL